MVRTAANALPAAPATGVREALRKVRVAHGLIDAPHYVTGPFGHMLDAPADEEAWNGLISNNSTAAMHADLHGQLAGQMLPKTDNMSMAASLECRVPLLDLELVALAAAAPMSWKRAGRTGKLPLRRQLARHLPAAITNRPKQGFRVPMTSWLQGRMGDELRNRLLTRHSAVEAIVPHALIERLLADHSAGQAEHSIRIFALLALNSSLARIQAE